MKALRKNKWFFIFYSIHVPTYFLFILRFVFKKFLFFAPKFKGKLFENFYNKIPGKDDKKIPDAASSLEKLFSVSWRRVGGRPLVRRIYLLLSDR